ncbi:MAG: 3,4-dihydroxy-2-butanone-4-phosphate synthase [Pseudomonadota bacterium]
MRDFPITSVPELLDDLRQGRLVVVMDDQLEARSQGVVMVAAEHCTAQHITLMARQARGLVCLALTRERCEQLNLPPMVDRDDADSASFTLSIEAAHGIDTGISAADRAHTVQVAVSSDATAADIVQPGHIFPLASEPGGVLTRAGHTEAAVDYVRAAGLTPAAVVADILDGEGELADAQALVEFAQKHQLKIGAVADLIDYRLTNEQTVERVREGNLATAHGEFRLVAYRDETYGGLHLALTLGEIHEDVPLPVRVHFASTFRDLLESEAPGTSGWSVQRSLEVIAQNGSGVLVLLSRNENEENLLRSVDLALGNLVAPEPGSSDRYNTIGIGSQILRDLGVGKLRLMGAPIKYNAISGFGLEVTDTLRPD